SRAGVAVWKAFYGSVRGWAAETAAQPEAGGYTMFAVRGKNVAAASPMQDPKQAPAWNTYVATDDADAAAKKVQAAGGTVLAEPFDVMDVGRMGVFMDPQGAVVSVWQAKLHIGAALVNEPGAFCWNELHTRDT